jgi:hypothetical protein
MRDSDLLETAAWLLSASSDEPFDPDSLEDREPVEVALDLYFGDGYTLDQLAGTLDVLDTLLTAGFIAAEARARQAEPRIILDQLSSGSLAVSWAVESVESGSLRIKAVLRRTGGWVSRHKKATLLALGAVSLVAPHVGIPLIVTHAGVIHIAAFAAQRGVEGIAWVHDRSVQKAQSQGAGTDATPPLPEPEIKADVRPLEPPVDVPEPPVDVPGSTEPRIYIDIVHIDGLNAQRAAFREQVRALEGVKWANLEGSGDLLRVGYEVTSPLDEATVTRIANETGVTVERIEKTRWNRDD